MLFTVVSEADRGRARGIISVLRVDGDGRAILYGDVSMPFSRVAFDPHGSKGEFAYSFLTRIEYQARSDGVTAVTRSRCIRLTLRKRFWAELRGEYAPPLAELAYLLRRSGLHPLFRVVPRRAGFALSVPSMPQLRELVRLLRLHGRLPDVDSLSRQYAAEREYERLRSCGDGIMLSYAGRRRPPESLSEEPFWAGRCMAVDRVSEPGRRHVRVMLLKDSYGETVLEVKPREHGLYVFLDAHRGRRLAAASVLALPDGARKPVASLIIASPN